MKIIHTADWHLGKKLYKAELAEDHLLFFKWLKELIKTESVDLLLVAGDIFDLANPAQADRARYYQALSDFFQLGIQVIITGGNHDSIGVLNAPKELLQATNVFVMGGAPQKPEDLVYEFRDKKDKLQALILAVPYLRDRDLRRSVEGQINSDRTAAVKEGIRNYYRKLAEYCKKKYKGKVPIIAMGHLYTHGASTSSSEREIQMGNEAGILSTDFPAEFDYLALGHIHRPQIINKQEHIRYSGSPIPLSFSESKDAKSLMLLQLDSSGIQEIRKVPIPQFRELKRFSGSLSEVREKLDQYAPDLPLASFVEVSISEPDYSPATIEDAQELAAQYNCDAFSIIKSRVSFDRGNRDADEIYDDEVDLRTLSPLAVFLQRIDTEVMDDDTKDLLIDAFRELEDTFQED